MLGFSYGAAQVLYLFERAFVPGTETLSRAFLRGVENAQAFDTNPFYAVLHEACYAQGGPTAWAAHRARGTVSIAPAPKRRPRNRANS